MQNSSLFLWSLETDPDGVAGWARRRVIDLRTLLPNVADPSKPLYVYLNGFAEGTDVMFASTCDGVFTIELDSWRVRKMW